MAKVSQREKILLGYCTSHSMSNSSSRRNSEVDFSDVFGGPPRCSSTQEFYQNESDNIDDDDDDIDGDSADGLRSSWFGLREKPVFGEQIGVRRRYPSDDFYGDIFGGDQPLLSCSLSPRVHIPGRNSFSSAPGSRPMSPSRPLPPAPEPSSIPLKFSLPGRTTNPDVMTSTSMKQSSKLSGRFLSRFNQTIQNHSAVHVDPRSSYQPSALSRQVSVDVNESTSDSKLDGTEYEGESSMNSKGSELQNENIQFHFSIYKWASKGVPFVMASRKRSPSRSKERMKSERYLSSAEGIDSAYLVMENSKGNVIVSSKRQMPSTSQAKEHARYNDTIVNAVTAECQTEDDTGAIVYNVDDTREAPSTDKLQGMKDVPNLSQKSSDTVADDNSLKNSSKMTKSNMRSLGSLFVEERKGRKKTATEKVGKKNKVNETQKLFMSDDISSNNVNRSKGHKSSTGSQKNDDISSYKANKSKVHKSSTRAKDTDGITSNNVNKSKVHKSSTGAKNDVSRSEAAGKVKDFVKIFNQDSTSNPKGKGNVVGKSRSWRWKNTTAFEPENEVKTFEAENLDDIQASYVNLEKTWSDCIEVVDEESFLSEKQQYTINGNDKFSGTTNSAPNDDPYIDGIRASAPKTNATSVDDSLVNGMVQEIDTQLATESQEETQSYERKVRQWSKGKEGNIRALLSTMQYILWPNSGWKPIPLVDIIEANAVKKAYQRALLCLHPDKLQQKGAAPYQKYIAEKVFDVLQEAWDQFNAIGLLS